MKEKTRINIEINTTTYKELKKEAVEKDKFIKDHLSEIFDGYIQNKKDNK